MRLLVTRPMTDRATRAIAGRFDATFRDNTRLRTELEELEERARRRDLLGALAETVLDRRGEALRLARRDRDGHALLTGHHGLLVVADLEGAWS